MVSNFFASCGFAICALAFLFLILLMYLSKKKFNSVRSTVFTFLLTISICAAVVEILYVYAMAMIEVNPVLTEEMCRLYILFNIIWVMSFMFYISVLLFDKKDSKKRQKITTTIFIVSLTLFFIIYGISRFLPIKYFSSKSSLYSFGGPAVIVAYVIGIVLILLFFLLLSFNKISLIKEQRFPMYFSVIFFIVTLLIQAISGYDFNTLSFQCAFMMSTLYFTVESQDGMLLNELKESKNEAEIADKSKTEFLSNMSHEIRTPLNTILGFSDVLLNEKNLNEKIIKRDTKHIYDASISLLNLINNILDISRIESGKEKIIEKEYYLKSLIFEVNSAITSKTKNNGVEYNLNVNKDLPSKYYGDYSKLYKIITCVAINALKYTGYGKIDIKVDGKALEDFFYQLEFTIANSGHVMKQEDFDKDFDDFIKLSSDNKDSIDSTTLGLIIAKRLVKMLNGQIKFINEPGYGTQYQILIPQKSISNLLIGELFSSNDNQTKDSIIIDCTGKKILIVDDNDINVKLTTRLLGPYNFEINSATSGYECIEKVRENKYDMIFLDHMMPQMDGIQTMRKLKTSGYYLPPVVALTANSFDDAKDEYIKEGFSDYLSKPIIGKDLNRIINKFFEEKK